MRLVPPNVPTRRHFPTLWSELQYVCAKIHYWLHLRSQSTRARQYLSRLEVLLSKIPDNDPAILADEGRSLLYELRGDLHRAIEHRQREIDRIVLLHESVKKQDEELRASILIDWDKRALKVRQDILEKLVESEGGSCRVAI